MAENNQNKGDRFFSDGTEKPEGFESKSSVQSATPNQEQSQNQSSQPTESPPEGRPIERKSEGRRGLRGTAAMDPETRQEVARKGGLAVSRNRQHMAEIGRKGGQTVSKNRDHMASIGRKGGEASRGQR